MSNSPAVVAGERFGERTDEDLTRLHDDELEQSILDLKTDIDRDQARLALRVAEFHQRGISESTQGLSTRAWLRSRCRMTGRTASILLATGMRLRSLPRVAEAATSGAITHDGVRLLTQAQRRHPESFPAHEDVLVNAASHLSTHELRQAINHWEQQINHPSAEELLRRQRAKRRFFHSRSFDGMWTGTWDLDPEAGNIVATAVKAYADPWLLDESDVRTPTQVRADALVDICRYFLDHSGTLGTSGGTKPHVTVTVDLARLIGREPGFGAVNGDPLSMDDIHRITCDASVVRMVLDPKGDPLDLGRAKRTIPSAVRKALDKRDGGCTWEGCDAPVDWCDAHHIVPWGKGGETSLSNLQLLCRSHHTKTHNALAS